MKIQLSAVSFQQKTENQSGRGDRMVTPTFLSCWWLNADR